MIYYEELVDIKNPVVHKKRGAKTKPISDTIYTFDIEVSNLFLINGEWTVFDRTLSKDYYTDVDKLALPYIWQFGIEDDVYYGREFMDFDKVLKQLSDKDVTKVIYVHNLSYEMAFLINILVNNNYHVSNMISRDIHKPISFHIDELNIEFRCSYMLTNMSLANSAREYTDIEKLDTLDYDDHVRTPLSPLTDQELMYCEYDIRCLTGVIRHFLGKYEHMSCIPPTLTAIARTELRKRVDYYYVRHMQQLVSSVNIRLIEWACFSGGYTHTNILRAMKIWKYITCMDIASSYPYTICCERLPVGKFHRCPKYKFNCDPNFGYIAKIRFNGVHHKYYNHYMQVSKCIDPVDLVNDNGRVVSIASCDMWLTNIDFDIIIRCYDVDDYEVLDCYDCYLEYLDERVIKYVLELYGNKTKLKGIKDMEAIYKQSKSVINSLYGISVQNVLKQSSDFVNNEWIRKAFSREFVADKLEDQKHSMSNLFPYAVGVFITAYSRKHLMECVLYSRAFDRDVCYCDTDSIKYLGNYDYIFEAYNKGVIRKYKKVIQKYKSITLDDFMPTDPKGNKHPIGFYEFDGSYEEAVFMGAKKYAYRENGELHLTLAGVSKSGVTALNNDLRNFKKGLVFDYDHSGKLTHSYLDNMTEADVDGYHTSLSYGVVLYPTTYTLGTTDIYDLICERMQIRDAELRGG